MPGFNPFFCFEFSDIVPGFDPFFCFGFSSIVLGFDPFFLFRVLRHHAWIHPFFSGAPASCLYFISDIVSGSLIFQGIVLGFLSVLYSWRLNFVSLRYWVRGQNSWSSGFFTRVHFTLESLALHTHDSLVHSLY